MKVSGMTRSLPLGVALAVALVGCGSSSTTSGAISKSQYIARADAVCSTLKTQLRALSHEPNLEQALRESLAPRTRALAQLRAIPVPSPAGILPEWMHLSQVALVETRKAVQAQPTSPVRARSSATAETLGEHARQLAEGYGMTVCDEL